MRIAASVALVLMVGWSPVAQAEPPNRAPQEHCERLLKRLDEVAQHWKQLPQPSVPRSGLTPEAIEQTVSPAQVASTEQELQALLRLSGAHRQAALQKWSHARAHTELDVWLAAIRAEAIKATNPAQALFWHELSLDIGELQGRGDVLGWSSGATLGLCSLWVRPQQQLPTAAAWVLLPASEVGDRQAAQLVRRHAQILIALGQNEQALDKYRTAGALSEHASDKQGVGAAWVGEADAKFRQGHCPEALSAYQKARELFARTGDKLGEATAWEGEAEVQFRLGQNEAAIFAYQKAAGLFAQIRDQRGEGSAWMGEAYVRFRRKAENDQALLAYKKAQALFTQLDDKLEAGNAWFGEAEVLFLLGQTKAALGAYQRARRLFAQMGAMIGEGNAWVGEADVEFRQGHTEEALSAYRKARGLFTQMDEKLGQGNTWRGEADVMFRQGRPEEALSAYQKARELYAQMGAVLGEGNAWIGEAEVRFLLSQNEVALSANQTARRLSAQIEDKQGQGNAWLGEAKVRLRLGHNEAALGAYQKARELFEHTGDKQGQGSAWFGEAEVMFRQGQDEAALRTYQKARGLYAQAGSKQGEAGAGFGEAAVMFRQGRNEAALSAYQKTRGLFVQMGDKLGEGNAWLSEAEVALSLHRFRDAEMSARRAIRLAHAAKSLGGEIRARVILMRTLDAARKDTQAMQEAEALLPFAPRWRAMGLTDWDRTHFAEEVTAPYDGLIPRLAQSTDPRQRVRALRYAEEAHAPVLRDLFRARERRARAPASPPPSPNQLTLQHRQAELGSQIQQVHDVAARAKLEHERIALEAEVESAQYDYLAAQGSVFVTSQPISDSQIKSLTLEQGPILLYYAADKEVVGFLLVPGRAEPIIQRIALTREELGRTVSQLRYLLANYALWEKQALRLRRELGEKLIAPFLAALGDASHLVIIPHGALHQLPFEALMPQGQPMPLALSMAPSLSALSELAGRRRGLGPSPAEPRFVALAAGRGLRQPDQEMDQIAAIFGSNRTRSYQAETDISSYRQLTPAARHLLVISHGVQREGSRLGTYLEIKADKEHDERLNAAEIAEMPLQAELVTLAACDTARAEALWSDERLDLTRAFLIAGAASVLATRWKVPDSEETTRFLVDFYTGLRMGENGKPLRKDEALKRARERAIQNKVSAQVWAAWVLIGDGA